MESIREVARLCHYFPWSAKFHLVLVDEADQMSHAAQLAFLSTLDATGFPPNTIFIFTANSTDLLQNRFLSRLHKINFGSENINKTLPSYLARIRFKETGKKNGIDFKALAETSEGKVREALNRLELELLADGVPEEKPKPKPSAAKKELTRY